MATYYDDAEPLGLPPLYESPAPKSARLRHALVYALIVAVTMAAATLIFNALGEPSGHMGMTCWNSGDHNGAVVCAMQPPNTGGAG